MFHPVLQAVLLAALILLPAPRPALAEGPGRPSLQGELAVVRMLLEEGRPAEALRRLQRSETAPLGEAQQWEIKVLKEACFQALGEPPSGPAPAGRARPRLRVAQVLLFEGKTVEEIENNLVRLKEAGVDTVFIRVFHNIGDRPLLAGGPRERSGVYFRTGAAPVLADYLGQIIPVCRRLGLTVFAWMTTRRCEWMLSERPELAELAFDADTSSILPSRSLNIFHPAVRAALARLYRDLASYDIDGILFQDDLVLKAGEGFSPEAIAAYMEDGGEPVSPGLLFRTDRMAGGASIFSPDNYRSSFWAWAAWKNRRLLDLAWDLMGAVRQVRPGVRFALNLYYEAVLNPRMALAWYGQDLGVAQGYPFDYFSLMSYHRQIGRELSLSGEEALQVLSTMNRRAVGTVGSPARVIMKVQSLDWETSALLPADELDRALAAAAPVEGTSIAFVRSISDPPLDVIRKHFRREGR